MPDMRFAPPPSLRIATQDAGLNQMSVRSTNERVILSLLVEHGALSRLELGQMSGLSAQTISVIVRALQRDGLIVAGEALRGRVGPPTVPVALNPDGVCALGLGLSSFGLDAVVMGLTGACHRRSHQSLGSGDDPVTAMERTTADLLADLDPTMRARVAGIGLSLPSSATAEVTDGPWAKALADGAELERRLGLAGGLPVYIQNGVTAAAGAESLLGAARGLSDFLFVYLGAATEYRLVLQHRVYAGDAHPGNRQSPADLLTLARNLGRTGDQLWQRPANWEGFGQDVETWLSLLTVEIADSARALSRFVAVDTLLLAGLPPPAVRDRLITGLASLLPDIRLISGEVTSASTAVGAATLALTARFFLSEQA